MSKSTHKLLLVTLFALLFVATLALCACGPSTCEHNYSDWEVKTDATCISTGEKQRTCTKCGDVQTETIAVAEHTFGDWHDEVSATCIADGTVGHKDCSVCNKHFDVEGNEIENIVITALGHDVQNHPAQEANCKQVGWDAYETCSRCNYTTYVEKPKEHNFVDGICIGCEIELATGLSYTESDDGTYYIVSGLGEETRTEFAIPSTYNGKPVLEIGTSAFREKLRLLKVIIPSGVTKIGENAFRFCEAVTDIVIPSTVTEIGENAFRNCTNLKNVSIPLGVEKIPAYTFYECIGLENIEIPSSVTEIGYAAFRGCIQIENITIPTGVKTIGEQAFYNCTGLTSVVIPSSVISLGKYAFYQCSSLVSVDIPSSVTSIGENTFKNCTSLVSVVVPSSVTSIQKGAFCDCTSLSTINFTGTEDEWNAISKGSNWDCYYINISHRYVQLNYTVNCNYVEE